MKLNHTQAELLGRLKAAKLAYDRDEERLKAEFEAAREQRKDVVRRLVADAVDNDIPVRQIHIHGLGMAQVGQMTNFLQRKGSALSQKDELKALAEGNRGVFAGALDQIAHQQREVRQGHNMAHWTNAAGEARSIERFPYGGNVYYIPEGAWWSLTDEDRDIIGHDGTITLGGDDEIDAYDTDGTVPERYNEK